MTTNDSQEAVYTVIHVGNNPADDGLPKIDYTQAINVATRWLKEERDSHIYDGGKPILRVYHRGVEFVEYDPGHDHFEEHIKIKLALDKVWGEIWSKRLRW